MTSVSSSIIALARANSCSIVSVSIRQLALSSWRTASGSPATKAQERTLSGKSPRVVASLRSSAKNTSTVSPDYNLLAMNCSYAENESAAKAVSSACLIFSKVLLSSGGSCWYTAKAPPVRHNGMTVSGLEIQRNSQTNAAFSSHSTTSSPPPNSSISRSSAPATDILSSMPR